MMPLSMFMQNNDFLILSTLIKEDNIEGHLHLKYILENRRRTNNFFKDQEWKQQRQVLNWEQKEP